jgi:hypothetical protein
MAFWVLTVQIVKVLHESCEICYCRMLFQIAVTFLAMKIRHANEYYNAFSVLF